MLRKEILWLMSRMSVVIGEFLNGQKRLWGGSGWETLAVGTVLIQGFNFADGEFEQIFSNPKPPLLPVRSQNDILTHLLQLADNPDQINAIGKASKLWFEQYNGIGLAKRWLSLLSNSKTN